MLTLDVRSTDEFPQYLSTTSRCISKAEGGQNISSASRSASMLAAKTRDKLAADAKMFGCLEPPGPTIVTVRGADPSSVASKDSEPTDEAITMAFTKRYLTHTEGGRGVVVVFVCVCEREKTFRPSLFCCLQPISSEPTNNGAALSANVPRGRIQISNIPRD